ncbi:MAG: hypothetical protein ACM3X2_00985, partial [Pseudomonadota bacterium]
GWDHIAVAWLDQNGELQFGQMVQGTQLVGYGERLNNSLLSDLFGSVSDPGSLGELLSDYGAVKAIPFDLSPYGQEVRDLFVSKLEEALKPGNIYSFLDNGHNCTSAVFWALGEAFKEIAPVGTGLASLQEAFKQIESRLAGINPGIDLAALKSNLETLGDVKVHTVTPNDLYLLSIFLLAQGIGVATAGNSEVVFRAAGDEAALAFPAADVIAAIAQWAPIASGEKGASHLEQIEQVAGVAVLQGALASDNKDAPTNDAGSPKVTTDGNPGASPSEQAASASDAENARTNDAGSSKAATDGNQEASPPEQPAIASDAENARADDAAPSKPATDGNQAASPSEQPAIASDNENAPTDGAAVMETAKAEVGADSTVDDQAAAAGQDTTSSAVIPDDGFSFAAFAKQGVTVEAAKEAMPVEHPSPEASSSPETPVGESAPPDVGSEDVGNAAPSKEPVVHHGDLAP